MDAGRLTSIPLFASLSKKERAQVARCADELEIGAGKRLLGEGEFAYEFCVVLDGVAEVRKGDDLIAELGPGDVFGEIALLATERRTATVVASTPMRIAVMTDRDFRTMARDLPEVAARLREEAARRLARTP